MEKDMEKGMEKNLEKDTPRSATTAQAMYLDLLKKTLTFSLWPEPPRILKDSEHYRSRPKRIVLKLINTLIANRGLVLANVKQPSASMRADGIDWPAYADTMIGLKRLDNLQFCIETVLQDKIPGDFIETGVWRGGACIFMRAALAVFGVTGRKIFVADSFQGLPEADPIAYPADKSDHPWHLESFLAVSKAEVEQNFRRYDLLDDQVVFLAGWFHETLPTAPIDTLAILRMDGDMYASTMPVLENLYPKLASGGFCIVDDYTWKGARTAVEDYRKQFNITDPIIAINSQSVYWRKA